MKLSWKHEFQMQLIKFEKTNFIILLNSFHEPLVACVWECV